MGLDIGPETLAEFGEKIRGAKTVVWNGPMGVFEWPAYAEGTVGVARACAESSALTIVGGGDTAAAAEAFGLADRFSHISTGGGASLQMLEGRPMESVNLLDEA